MKYSKKQHESAAIIPKVIEKEFLYDSMVILTLKINYPQLAPQGRCAFKKINAYYLQTAKGFLKYTSAKLYRAAVTDYQAAIRESRPFLRHEALITYNTIYNQSCLLSIYYDRYEYTGGAHGTTLRIADSWNLNNSYPLVLKDIFSKKYKYKKAILSWILKSIAAQTDGMYFENYKRLAAKNFDPENFYFTPEGLCFFYQEYDIAPRPAGRPEFIIPYDAINASSGMCTSSASADSQPTVTL